MGSTLSLKTGYTLECDATNYMGDLMRSYDKVAETSI